MQKSKIIVGNNYEFKMPVSDEVTVGKVVEYGGNGSVKLALGASGNVTVVVDRSRLIRTARA